MASQWWSSRRKLSPNPKSLVAFSHSYDSNPDSVERQLAVSGSGCLILSVLLGKIYDGINYNYWCYLENSSKVYQPYLQEKYESQGRAWVGLAHNAFVGALRYDRSALSTMSLDAIEI